MGNSADGPRNGVHANGIRAQRNPDKLAPVCVRLLEEAGFTYDRQMGAWLNIPAGRVIAFDRVANRSPEWLAAWLGLSRFHPLFIANGHDVRTVRSGSPALVLVSGDNSPRPLRVGRHQRGSILHRGRHTSQLLAEEKELQYVREQPRHESIKLTADTNGSESAQRIRTTALDDDEPVAMKP